MAFPLLYLLSAELQRSAVETPRLSVTKGRTVML